MVEAIASKKESREGLFLIVEEGVGEPAGSPWRKVWENRGFPSAACGQSAKRFENKKSLRGLFV